MITRTLVKAEHNKISKERTVLISGEFTSRLQTLRSAERVVESVRGFGADWWKQCIYHRDDAQKHTSIEPCSWPRSQREARVRRDRKAQRSFTRRRGIKRRTFTLRSKWKDSQRQEKSAAGRDTTRQIGKLCATPSPMRRLIIWRRLHKQMNIGKNLLQECNVLKGFLRALHSFQWGYLHARLETPAPAPRLAPQFKIWNEPPVRSDYLNHFIRINTHGKKVGLAGGKRRTRGLRRQLWLMLLQKQRNK